MRALAIALALTLLAGCAAPAARYEREAAQAPSAVADWQRREAER